MERRAGHADTPMTTLLHGLLKLARRRISETWGWRNSVRLLYVFGHADAPGRTCRNRAGRLGPMDAMRSSGCGPICSTG
ncbi:hypothetical protein ACRAWD_03395 [Caulobacter segnis]